MSDDGASQSRRVSTLEDLLLLQVGSVLYGPRREEEVYKKTGDASFHGIGSEVEWLASSLESRGPFIVLWPEVPHDPE